MCSYNSSTIIRHGTRLMGEYLRMSERKMWDCVYKFVKVVIILYHGRYLRKPTISDINQVYIAHKNKHVFPGNSWYSKLHALGVVNVPWCVAQSVYARWSNVAENNFRSSGIVWPLNMTCIFWSIGCQQHQCFRPIVDIQRHLPW